MKNTLSQIVNYFTRVDKRLKIPSIGLSFNKQEPKNYMWKLSFFLNRDFVGIKPPNPCTFYPKKTPRS